MAGPYLENCRACGHKMSTRAVSCPSCGHIPNMMRHPIWGPLIIACIVIAYMVVVREDIVRLGQYIRENNDAVYKVQTELTDLKKALSSD